MNLHTKFTAQGQKAFCNLCGTENQTPGEHFGAIDQHGRRTDENPIYYYGSYELLVDIGDAPKLPTFVFLIDISSTAIMNGFFYQTVTTIKQCLDYFPNSENTQVTFVTFDQAI
jgi:hypothetical protein